LNISKQMNPLTVIQLIQNMEFFTLKINKV